MLEEEYIMRMQNDLSTSRLNMDRENLMRMQQEQYMDKEERSMIKEQLDLSDQITRIDYLLKGYSLQPNSEGELVWTAPTTEDMKVFSDYGIQLIMNTICFYLNQNTLLSNYTDEQIKHKMRQFTKELVFIIFKSYDKIFRYPSVEECLVQLRERLERQSQITSFANSLKGINIPIEKIYEMKIKDIEDRIETEIENIKQTIIKNKLNRFELLVRVIQDAVHSTYQRAWNGQERASIRLHMTVSEVKGNHPMMPVKGGIFPWGKK
jgi:hypothetical protein